MGLERILGKGILTLSALAILSCSPDEKRMDSRYSLEVNNPTQGLYGAEAFKNPDEDFKPRANHDIVAEAMAERANSFIYDALSPKLHIGFNGPNPNVEDVNGKHYIDAITNLTNATTNYFALSTTPNHKDALQAYGILTLSQELQNELGDHIEHFEGLLDFAGEQGYQNLPATEESDATPNNIYWMARLQLANAKLVLNGARKEYLQDAANEVDEALRHLAPYFHKNPDVAELEHGRTDGIESFVKNRETYIDFATEALENPEFTQALTGTRTPEQVIHKAQEAYKTN